jgi:Cu(I)/Ag(I) efflux system membrane fusion protein
MRRTLVFGTILLAVLTLAIYGCGSPSNDAEQTPSPPAGTSNAHGNHDDHSHDDMDTMKAELAKLSPEDAASAESQHLCPVSGEMLGTMGAPKKIDVNGRQVWICCEHCEEKLLANPDEYMAKLKKE